MSILHRLVIDTLLAAPRSAQAALRPPGRGSGRRARDGRVPAGRPGHAGHGRPHPHDQRARRADARQEHLLLSQAAQRAGHQSAGVGRQRLSPAHVSDCGRCLVSRETVTRQSTVAVKLSRVSRETGRFRDAVCVFHVKRCRSEHCMPDLCRADSWSSDARSASNPRLAAGNWPNCARRARCRLVQSAARDQRLATAGRES